MKFRTTRTSRAETNKIEDYKETMGRVQSLLNEEYNKAVYDKKCVVFCELLVFLANNDCDTVVQDYFDSKAFNKCKTLDAFYGQVMKDIAKSKKRLNEEQLKELCCIVTRLKGKSIPDNFKNMSLLDFIKYTKGEIL